MFRSLSCLIQTLCLEFFGFFRRFPADILLGPHVPAAIIATAILGLKKAAGGQKEGSGSQDDEVACVFHAIRLYGKERKYYPEIVVPASFTGWNQREYWR
jgi:hypothetical protein